MTINITITEHPFYFSVFCKIYGATKDELKKIEKYGLRNNDGWGGTELLVDGTPELNYSIRKVCSWAQNNGKSLVVKRITTI